MNNIKLQTMLAEHATVENGKLFIAGGGWSAFGPNPMPCAIAFLAKVPWVHANEQHLVVVELVDEDHMPFVPPDAPEDMKSIRIEIPLEVGRPPGTLVGSDLDWVYALNVGPLPLTPGKRYVWSVWLDGETEESWSLPFTVRSTPPGIRLVG